MKSDKEAEALILSIRSEIGYSRFDRIIKSIQRARLQIDKNDRPKRIKFPPAVYQKLFNDQKGICPECQEFLDVPAKKNEVDHRDCNCQEGFNDYFNLQLLHRSCNREKSSKPIEQLAKESGRTFQEILT